MTAASQPLRAAARYSPATAKANSIHAGKGRPASIDVAKVREMKAQGLRARLNP